MFGTENLRLLPSRISEELGLPTIPGVAHYVDINTKRISTVVDTRLVDSYHASDGEIFIFSQRTKETLWRSGPGASDGQGRRWLVESPRCSCGEHFYRGPRCYSQSAPTPRYSSAASATASGRSALHGSCGKTWMWRCP